MPAVSNRSQPRATFTRRPLRAGSPSSSATSICSRERSRRARRVGWRFRRGSPERSWSRSRASRSRKPSSPSRSGPKRSSCRAAARCRARAMRTPSNGLTVFDPTQGFAAVKAALAELSLDNFRLLVSDNLYVFSYSRSLVVAVVSTSILLVIGYPIAYGMARLPRRWQGIAMMLVIVPFWTSFLIRIYAWINILQHDGLLNKILLALHLVSTPVVWLSTDSAMYLGIVRSEERRVGKE